MKKLYIVFNLSLLLLPTSCSRIELAANWADTYIVNHIDKYFEVNSMQSQFIKKAVKDDVDEIRKKVFPSVADELESFQKKIESNTVFTFQDIDHSQLELKKIFYDTVAIFEPNAQVFLKKLTTQQLEIFKSTFDKKTKELESDLENPADAKKKRFHKIKDQFQSWVGTLNNDQLFIIQQFTADNLPPLKEQLRNREKLSKEFLDSFKNAQSQSKFVSQLFTNYESMRDPDYAKASSIYQKKLLELVVVILNQLTPEQKKHLIDTIKDRAEQIRETAQNKKGFLG